VDELAAVDSIMNNVDSLIRFLYFFSRGNFNKDNNFQEFIYYINTALNLSNYKYAYLGEYANNTLIIGPNDNFIAEQIQGINSNVPERDSERIAAEYPAEYSDLKINPNFLIMRLTFSNILITKEYVTIGGTYRMRVQFQYRQTNSDIYINPKVIVTALRGDWGFTEKIAKLYQIIYQEEYTSNEELQSLYQEFITINFPQQAAKPASRKRKAADVFEDDDSMNDSTDDSTDDRMNDSMEVVGGGNVNSIILLLLILVSKGGSYQGNENDSSPYDKVLNVSFDKLYDTSNLAEKNITSLYFMFSLLRQYELSFVNYQEGININYTKINESYILSDLIGVTNLIPHNIELYVFLKLLLRDYNEEKLNSINYSLFEYYMYLSSMNGNILYSRFQNLKSYLNVYYTIDVDSTNIPNIVKKIKSQPVCYKSWTYFKEIMRETEAIKEQVISENYIAEQNGNYDVIYNNVEKYSLKLSGFSEMKSDFLSKTLDIISSMLSKGSLQKYSDMVNSITGKAQGDVAGVVPKPYKGFEPQPIIQSSFQQPIAVSTGGKRSRRKTRKNKKYIFKRRRHLNTKKIHRNKTHKKMRKVN
jgi:hypothetical protein